MTANYFNLLGIRPIIGRDFLPQEEMTADVALVTEQFWRNRLNSDPAVLGRSVTLNGVATTIIGVLPKPPLAWFGPNAEVFTVKPFDFPGTPKERLMRGMGFPAHRRPAETGRHGRSGAGGDGRARARLQAGEA